MSKTPEEMAEEYANSCLTTNAYILSKEGFLAGHRSRDEEVEQLKEEIAMLKADLREGFRDE